MISKANHGKFVEIGLQLCIFCWSKSWSNGKSVRRTWLREQPRENKKGCMPFYYCIINFVSKMVSSSKNRTTREEEVDKATTWG
jgi:hypothetical protein